MTTNISDFKPNDGRIVFQDGNLTINSITTAGDGPGSITGVHTISTELLTASGNVTAGNVLAGGFYFANGSPFVSYGDSNVAAYLTANPQGGTYGNSNVTAYLPTHGGNISASNITTTGASGNISGANVIISNINKTTATTVAALPAASTAGAGARAFVTDADSNTFNAALVGGGSNSMPVFSNGTSWFIG